MQMTRQKGKVIEMLYGVKTYFLRSRVNDFKYFCILVRIIMQSKLLGNMVPSELYIFVKISCFLKKML